MSRFNAMDSQGITNTRTLSPVHFSRTPVHFSRTFQQCLCPQKCITAGGKNQFLCFLSQTIGKKM